MDNFMIENGWQENIYFNKSYICIILYMILAYSMQSHIIPYRYSISYKQSLYGDIKVWGGEGRGGGDAHNISGFYAHCLGLNAAFYMCQI